MKIHLKKTGFTLVEVLVASTIGSFVALVAVGSLRVIIVSSEMVDENINAAAEVRFAANMIARDLVNFYRDENFENTKFIATVQDLEDGSSTSYLVFYALGRTKARAAQPEGDIYEVEYFLTKDDETSALMRRLWPNPSEDLEPGGILSVIAEDIEIFDIRYFDGEEWSDEWPEEMRALPQLAEITLVASSEQGAPPMESVIVNFVRSQGGEETTVGSGGPAGGPQSSGQTSNSGTNTQTGR